MIEVFLMVDSLPSLHSGMDLAFWLDLDIQYFALSLYLFELVPVGSCCTVSVCYTEEYFEI